MKFLVVVTPPSIYHSQTINLYQGFHKLIQENVGADDTDVGIADAYRAIFDAVEDETTVGES